MCVCAHTLSLQRDFKCSPQPAAKVARSSTRLPHHHSWWHCDGSHHHADPPSQVWRGPHSQPGVPSGPWELHCWRAWSCPSHKGSTSAPKITVSMSWVVWEEQTCDQISRLYRAIGSRVPLRTTWMGRTIKLLDFVGKCNISLCDPRRNPVPGSVHYQKESDTLAVCCKDGWVGFKTVVLKKRLTAADFYNGYLHQTSGGVFVSRKGGSEAHQKSQKSMLWCNSYYFLPWFEHCWHDIPK